MRNAAMLILVFLVCPAGLGETPPPQLVLKGLDPVELSAGREVAGLEALEVIQGRFRYRFANEANRGAFRADPVKHAVQWDGACGRMGPFTGTGSPDRWLVHAGKIYLFASESCREGFRKAPEKHLVNPDPIPAGDEAARTHGKELLALVMVGFGGEKAVDGVRSIRREETVTYRQGGKDYPGKQSTTMLFPDGYRVEESFGTPYGRAHLGKSGFEFSGSKEWRLEPWMLEESRRRSLAEPLMMLRRRGEAGFVAIGRGPELLEAHLDGVTVRWTLDRGTGRIVRSEHTERMGTVGQLSVEYGDFRRVGQLELPHSRVERFDGKEIQSPTRSLNSLEVDGKVEKGWFEMAGKGG